ncbi:MAG: 30S ribosomal protein S11, partial [Chloroflexi bacterium]|nr:30S ribosomal protein S11 [Chloroflexota bacterium]
MPEVKRTGKRSGRRRERRVTPRARAYIQATFNNTIITFTDPEGNVILWGSPGSLDPPFKGSRRSTPYAAQIAAQ